MTGRAPFDITLLPHLGFTAYPATTVDAIMQQSCCETSSGAGFMPAGACWTAGGAVVTPDNCYDCCLESAFPTTLELVRSGECIGVVQEKSQCESICCEIGTNHSYEMKLKCLLDGGAVVQNITCDGPPD